VNPEFAPFVYLPFAYFAFLLFSFLPETVYLSIFVCASILISMILARWVAVGVGLTQNWVSAACLLIIALLNYPFQFALDRGNLDLFVGFLCSVFVILYLEKRVWLSTPFLASAIALKGYPAVYLFLLVGSRYYGPACGAAVQAFLLTTLAVLVLPGRIAATVQGLLLNLAIFKKNYVIGIGSTHFSSDLLNLIKIQVLLGNLNWNIENILPWYSLTMLGLVILAFFYSLFADTLKWKKILFLTLAGLLFPYITNDYKLIILLIPAVAAVVESDKSANDVPLLVIMGLVLIPKAYGTLIEDASVSCLVNPILLVALCLLLLTERGVMLGALRQLKTKLTWNF
jgi:hypothetical protein